MLPSLSNLRVRQRLCQVLLGTGVVALLYFLASNASDNLVRQGVASGFDFLHSATGFNIASSLIDYDASSSYWRLFIAALLNTLLASGIAIIFATVIGFTVAILRLSQHPIASRMATIYIETLRNIPLLLQVLFWYFAVLQPLPSPRQSIALLDAIFVNNRGLHLPSPIVSGHYALFFITVLLTSIAAILCYWQARRYRIQYGRQHGLYWGLWRGGILLAILIMAYLFSSIDIQWSVPVLKGFNFTGGTAITPEFFALVLALSTYTGAYIAENVRSGILSVDKGQIEAARALGLRYRQIMRLIIIPNAMRVIIPPLTNQYLTLTKNSSLAAAIAYPDIVLVFAGTALNQTGQALEILFMVMTVYLSISLTIALLMNLYNRRIAIAER